MKTLEQYKPCKEALDFYRTQKDFRQAWANCIRGDWMLWIAGELKIDHRLITLTKAKCARTVEYLMKEPISLKSLDVAEAYGNGNASINELATADYDAYAAAAADYDAYAAYAAAAGSLNRLKTADICRELLTEEVVKHF